VEASARGVDAEKSVEARRERKMGVPKALQGPGFAKCGEYTGTEVDNEIPSRSKKDLGRNLTEHKFIAYIETGYQSKHDPKLTKEGGEGYRKSKGTHVNYGKQTPNEFYRDRGLVACAVVRVFLEKKWKSKATNNTAFLKDAKTVLSVQRIEQHDGYRYDITCYYGENEIYVSFHCYPPEEEKKKN
jgi:hypothetical protein